MQNKLFALLLLILLPVAFSQICKTTLPARDFSDGQRVEQNSCAYTNCDVPSTRDQFLLKPGDEKYTVKINAIYFGNPDSQALEVYQQQLDYFQLTYTQLANINFTISTRFVNSGPYLSTRSDATTTHRTMAQMYYQENQITLMFTSFSDNQNSQFITLGYAVLPQRFPSIPSNFYMILDRNYAISPTGHTLLHEMGHMFGLLHTFTQDCDDECTEMVNSPDLNLVGDMCNDTLPHWRSFQCPTMERNTDCQGALYGLISTLPQDNFMAYTPDSCQDEFTPQQIARMRCYLTTVTPQFVVGYVPPPGASVAEKNQLVIGTVLLGLAAAVLF